MRILCCFTLLFIGVAGCGIERDTGIVDRNPVVSGATTSQIYSEVPAADDSKPAATEDEGTVVLNPGSVLTPPQMQPEAGTAGEPPDGTVAIPLEAIPLLIGILTHGNIDGNAALTFTDDGVGNGAVSLDDAVSSRNDGQGTSPNTGGVGADDGGAMPEPPGESDADNDASPVPDIIDDSAQGRDDDDSGGNDDPPVPEIID